MRKLLLFVAIIMQPLLMSGQKALDRGPFHRGEGNITFNSYKPLADKPVNIHYYIPSYGNVKKMRVLFLIPGASRETEWHFNSWKPFAERDGFIILALSMPKEHYNINDTRRGGITVSFRNRTARPKELWTTNLIESIFTYVRKETGNRAKTYDMWGYQLGAQFIEAFLIATPKARVGKAIMARASNYTMPYVDGFEVDGRNYNWPYSLKDSPFTSDKDLKAFFSKNLIISIGDRDKAGSGKGFPQDKATYGQGETVRERANFFYQSSKKLAESKGMKFNWELVEVPGVGGLSRSLVYGRSRYNRTTKKRTYNVNRTRSEAAYGVLFGEEL